MTHTNPPSENMSFSWQVKIGNHSTGETAGAGVLVADRTVLTCAHVANEACEEEAGVGSPVRLTFPQIDREPVSSAIVYEGWDRDGAANRADIALLRMDKPPPDKATSARLARWQPVSPPSLIFCGYPFGKLGGQLFEPGRWTRVQTAPGRSGPDARWVEFHRTWGADLQPGFSGAGAVGEPDGCVRGLVVIRLGTDTGWMIPMETIVGHLPELAGLLTTLPSEVELARHESERAGHAALDDRDYPAAIRHLRARLAQPEPPATIRLYLALAMLGGQPTYALSSIEPVLVLLRQANHLVAARLLALLVDECQYTRWVRGGGPPVGLRSLIEQISLEDARLVVRHVYAVPESDVWAALAHKVNERS